MNERRIYRFEDAEWHVPVAPAQEAGGNGVQVLRRCHVQVQKARERQVDLLHLRHRQILDEA